MSKYSSVIPCTYCVYNRVPATKSCLLCEASLCDVHLKAHSKSEEHLLTEPTNSWGSRKCSIHKELLKYFCAEDVSCICESCLDESHKEHQVEPLPDAFKKKKLRHVIEKLKTKKEETVEIILSLQEHERGVQEKSDDLTVRVSGMFVDLREHLEVLEKQVLSDITQKEKQIVGHISDLIQKLENDEEELSERISHLEEVGNLSDLLSIQEQQSPNSDPCDAEREVKEENLVTDDKKIQKRKHNVVPDQEDLDEFLISLVLDKGLFNILTDVKTKRGLCMQKASDILLDVNTAGNSVKLSEDLRTAFYCFLADRPKTPERFDRNQVLSIRNFSSGQHYWEVEICKSFMWRVGMSYHSISRSGSEAEFGYNSKSWCLSGASFSVSAYHDSKRITINTSSYGIKKLGIFLDYEAGCLSFYDLTDTIKLLHTFNATFTEPLHAAICVHCSDEIRILG
ncbi:E3 ubiquitin/ISG15 ligase TRIM25-like [Bombina bombina]|nr:E3 ubiquitin/ISG15 ligase TRIM25-like [Bombina bombina]